MLRVFADAGYQVERKYADGVVHLSFPIAPHRAVAARCSGAASTRAEAALDRPAARAARRSRSTAPAPRGAGHRRGGARPPARRRLHRRRSCRCTRARPTVAGLPRVPVAADAAGAVDLAVVAVPPAGVADGGRRRGRRRACTASSWSPPASPRPAAAARPRQRELIRACPRGRHAGGRPELPGDRQHRPDGTPQRHARPAAAGRPAGSGSSASPARSVWPCSPQADRRGLGLSQFRLGRQPRRRVRQRPAAVLAGRPRHRRRPALPGDVRQPAQVRPAGPADRAAPSRSSRWPPRPARPALGGDRARARTTGAVTGAVRPLRRDPGRHRRRAVRRRAAAGRPAAAGRAAGSRVVGNSLGAAGAGRRRLRRERAGPSPTAIPRDVGPTAGADDDRRRRSPTAAVDARVDALVVAFAPPLPGQRPDEDADFARRAGGGVRAWPASRPAVATSLLGVLAARRAGVPVRRGGGPGARPGRRRMPSGAREPAGRRLPRASRRRLGAPPRAAVDAGDGGRAAGRVRHRRRARRAGGHRRPPWRSRPRHGSAFRWR